MNQWIKTIFGLASRSSSMPDGRLWHVPVYVLCQNQKEVAKKRKVDPEEH